jgi:D-alanyl-lipoteichoic acid acyltransferase DltB (MBOAT superfamily)
MPFSSFGFLLFLPVVALVHAGLRRFAGARPAQAWLLLASLFFYAFPRPAHLPLLVLSILFNWAVANRMAVEEDAGRRRACLWLGLAANIALLASFKYVAFFLGQIGDVSGIRVSAPNWDFPLGISFFTLTQVMYLVDCYQKMNGPISLFDHATVASFFPYVSSGPIVRAKEIADQFETPRPAGARIELASRGVFLFAQGLAKKVVFADTFATIADTGFAAVGQLSSVEAWAFSLAYTLQIYFDFSGYSDMAVGSAWILGFDIPQNFKAPYIAKSISEFWQRWHISLSNFITNYLYTPILRGMGKATLRTSAIATLLAMGIAGLWHGPGWTYIVFGLMHGAALAINQYWKKSKRRLPDGLGWLVTFLFVNATFIVFRSRDLKAAGQMFKGLVPHGNVFGTALLSTVVPLTPSVLLKPVAIGAVLAFFFKSSWDLASQFKPSLRNSMATAALLVAGLLFLNSSAVKQFVYFAF